MGTEIKKKKPRLLIQHVAVDRRDIDAIRPQRLDHGIYFVASQNKITGDSGLAATGRLEVDGNSHAHRSHRSNLHSVFRNRIAPRHIELIDPAVGLSFDADKLVELRGIKVDGGRRSGCGGGRPPGVSLCAGDKGNWGGPLRGVPSPPPRSVAG